MDRRDSLGACTLLATLWAAVAVQAQEVHKCTVNGQVTYQARPCAAADVMLPTAPTPSEQEQRQARGDLSRQRYEAATGRIYQPVHVPPPPPPPAPAVQNGTSTTTIIVLPSDSQGGTVIIRRGKRAATSTSTGTSPAPLPPPANNCEKLNRDNTEAQERRDQLQAPSELASRQEALQRAVGDVARIHDMAQASNCRLAR